MNAALALWGAVRSYGLSWCVGLALGIFFTVVLPDINFLPGMVLAVSILALGRIITELRSLK